jgi:hypothetical protein
MNLKEEFNTDTEILKKNQIEILEKLNNLNKNSVESITNRIEQVENRVSGSEDDVEELSIINQTMTKKIIRKYEWDLQDLWHSINRPNLHIMDVEEAKRY